MRFLLACVAVFARFGSAAAAPGDFDLTFGGTGYVTTDVGGSTDSAQSVAIQSDGRIVAAGYSLLNSTYGFSLVRYNVDGSVDTTLAAC